MDCSPKHRRSRWRPILTARSNTYIGPNGFQYPVEVHLRYTYTIVVVLIRAHGTPMNLESWPRLAKEICARLKSHMLCGAIRFQTYTHIHTYTYTYTYVYIHICIYVYAHVHKWADINKCIYGKVFLAFYIYIEDFDHGSYDQLLSAPCLQQADGSHETWMAESVSAAPTVLEWGLKGLRSSSQTGSNNIAAYACIYIYMYMYMYICI